MQEDDAWRAIDEQRRRIVELLEELSDREWAQPSLCQGWTVGDVAAHVALQNTTWAAVPRSLLDVVKAGGMNGAIQTAARRHGRLPREQIIAEIRDWIGIWRPLPTVTYRETAIDYLVHAQDIAIPLGRQLPTLPDLAVLAVERVWNSPRMFHARKTFNQYRLVATDTPWVAGQGEEVTGPIGALLLLLTGRPIALAQLSGRGAETLRASLPTVRK